MLRSWRDKITQDNQAEFKDLYDRFRWVTEEEGVAAAEQRRSVLSALEGQIHLRAKGTKPHFGPLSPGCELCAQGLWSCLFVNGKCNCRCFYCPAEQNSVDIPRPTGFPFRNQADMLNIFWKSSAIGV